MKNAIPSAMGTANHTPVIPQRADSSGIPPAVSPKVRRKDKNAETFPFDNAVNIADVKIFRPQNRKLQEKIRSPFAAIA